MTTRAAVLSWLEAAFPLRLAAEWDNVGLLLGSRSGAAERIMACLTLTEAVAEEAEERQASLVVSHHPILFKGTKRLTADTAEGRILLRLAGAGVAVHCPHTAFDNAPWRHQRPLGRPARPDRRSSAPAARQRAEAGEARRVRAGFRSGKGAGRSVRRPARAGSASTRSADSASRAQGTFKGSEASNPAVGQKGRPRGCR